MMNHILLIPSGGYIGVDVFFVISGFVITGLLLRQIDRTGRIAFGAFYRQRARRILPAASLVIATTALLGFVLLPAERVRQLWGDAIAATFFAANWRMAAEETDYFQQGLPPSPLQHYWSLSIEEQFYFVWPAILLAGVLLATRIGVRKARWVPFAVVGAVIGASLAFSIYEVVTNSAVAYFSSFTRFWEIGVGAALAMVGSVGRKIGTRARVGIAYGGLVVIIIGAVTLTASSPFPGVLALVPVLGTAAVIFAGTGASTAHDRAMLPLTNPVARWLGDRSYSLYLWHFPVLILAQTLFPSRMLVSLGVLFVTILLSELTYRFIEDPIRRSSWLDRANAGGARGKARATAIVTASLTVLLCLGVTLPSTTATPSASAAPAESGCLGAAALFTEVECPAPSAVVPEVAKLQADTGGAFSADCYRYEKADPTTCTFGSTRKDAVEVALIGDSHAGMYMSVLRRLAVKMNWRVTTWVGWGCSWGPHEDQPCEEQTRRAQSDFTDATPYDVIITAAGRPATRTWDAGTKRTAANMWAEAAEAGSKILAMESVPVPSEESLLCIQRVNFDPSDNTCGTRLSEALTVPDAISEVAVKAGATVIPTQHLICDSRNCPGVVGGVIVFRDTAAHLTGSYLGTLDQYLYEQWVTATSVR